MRTIHDKRYKFIIRKLVGARHEADLKQSDVERKMKWSTGILSDVENRDRRLDIIELMDLAKVYKKPLEYFIKDCEKK